ncbi:hypothetical protein B566_EDAN004280 [Ephemera danica]|nr:hypothetical protein B566_EDAN004280 [Ephemera danica]
MTPWHRNDLIFSFSIPRRTGNKYRTIMFEFADKGYDTVATATAFILFLLGTHPDIQGKVVEELVEVFGDSGRLPDVADLANLKYLERCMKESLRLYPSACFMERTNQDEIHIDDYVIPAGCTITANIFAIHHDPEVYPDPEKFDPDRFLPENCQGRSPYSFIPFSIGARNCIGQKFAMLEEKTLVSTVLRRYRVEAMQERKELKLKAGIVLRPSNGVHIRIFERDDYPNLRVQEQT